jgi:IAA-amino acid hydrolase
MDALPIHEEVVTVGSIHGGDAMNVIPEEVRTRGTFRSLSKEDLLRVKRRIEEIATGIGSAHRCQVAVSYPIPEVPPMINDESAWNVARRTAERLVGPENVRRMDPVLGAEEFAFYQQRISVALRSWESATPIGRRGTTCTIRNSESMNQRSRSERRCTW